MGHPTVPLSMIHSSGMIVWLALASLIVPSDTLAADSDGWFGLSVEASGKGFVLNPTIVTVRIKAVAPASPAAEGGIAAGDEIIEIDGAAVTGRKARDMGTALDRSVGETLRLLMKRSNGEVYVAVLTAVREPD